MHSKKFNKLFNVITGSNICSECNELAKSAKFVHFPSTVNCVCCADLANCSKHYISK